MDSSEIREKYIKYFESKGHKQIDPSPLVLKNDTTTLFTSAGMQQLIPYLKGEEKHPKGNNLVNSQPCLRTQDIEEVGDNRHTTFFEMLGNWSIGDYFKEKQLPLIWEFFTKELGLPKEKLWATVFEGTKEVPKDEESYEIWKELGVQEEKIKYYGVNENWWSRSGPPDKMPKGEIGGPSSEIFFEFTKVKHNKKFGEKCHPNCECGRFWEIGNSVFIQYKKITGGKLEELPQKSVDFGGGLERLVAATNDNPDIFMIPLIKPVMDRMDKEIVESIYKDQSRLSDARILVDHIRASSFLIKDGVIPSNKMQGYILRRLLRRAAIKMTKLGKGTGFHLPWVTEVAWSVARESMKQYESTKYFKKSDIRLIEETVGQEMERFGRAMDRGLKIIEEFEVDQLNEANAFTLFQSYGFPFEVSKELFAQRGRNIDKGEFDKIVETHRKLSRQTSKKIFKGGLGDKSKETVKLHTATHLLHFALRKVLGESVRQEGSNITSERLRFDFSFDRKLTDEEIKEVEKLINKKIKENLPVTKTVENRDEALESGVLAFFKEKYPEEVTIYSISTISREFCGGPHVKKTSEIGRVRIERQKKIGSNMMRVYAVVEK